MLELIVELASGGLAYLQLHAELAVCVAVLALAFVCLAGAVITHDLLVATLLLGIFSLLAAIFYLVLAAPDVAMTEAAVGAGITTILLLGALTLTGRNAKPQRRGGVMALVIVLATTGLLLQAIGGLPRFGAADAPIHQHLGAYYMASTAEEIGIPSVVAAVLGSYRGFDTLGEVVVVFAAAVAIASLLLPAHLRRRRKGVG